MKSTFQISINRGKKLVHGSINTKLIVCLERNIFLWINKKKNDFFLKKEGKIIYGKSKRSCISFTLYNGIDFFSLFHEK